MGWVAFGPARDEDLDSRCAEIEAIYVASACWNRGIGTALIDAACAQLRREGYGTVVLWVLKDNTAARAFYGQLGFGHDGSAKQIEIGGTPLMEMRVVRELVV